MKFILNFLFFSLILERISLLYNDFILNYRALLSSTAEFIKYFITYENLFKFFNIIDSIDCITAIVIQIIVIIQCRNTEISLKIILKIDQKMLFAVIFLYNLFS